LRKLFFKKAFLLPAVITTVAAVAVAGYAYFSTSGSGTAPAAIGTSSAVTLHGTSAAALYPGTSSTVSFTVDNPGTGPQYVGTIHLASVVACDTAFVSGACPSGREISGCESINNGSSANAGTNNFYMADVAANQSIPSGTGQSVTATGTLTMNNLASSQDICKNANLLLNLTS
jgi:hypothetical protein